MKKNVLNKMLLVFFGILIGGSATVMYFELGLVSGRPTPQQISAILVHQISHPADGLAEFTFDVGNDCILKMKAISDNSKGDNLISPGMIECKNRPTENPLAKDKLVTKAALVTTQIIPPFYFNPQKEREEIMIQVNKFDLVEIIKNDI